MPDLRYRGAMTSTGTCRACGGAGLEGDGARCEACNGAWVAELALLDLVADAVNLPLSGLPWARRKARGPARACERCAAAMAPVALYDVDLDRCPGHGIWLDGDELERVLRAAPREHLWSGAGSTADVRPASPGPWVGRALLGDPDRLDDGSDGLVGALAKLLGR